MILAIDCTAEQGSIALCSEGVLVEEVGIHAPEGFAHAIFGEIDKLLRRQRVSLSGLQAFASASGPGSFTGVRVGLTAAKGLAFAGGKPLMAVSNLQAMAAFGTRALRAVVMNARRGEVYAGLFDAELRAVGEATVGKLEAFARGLPASELEILSQDFAELGALDELKAPKVQVPREIAGAIGKIAWARMQAGDVTGPEEVDANYIRRSDAELFWKE